MKALSSVMFQVNLIKKKYDIEDVEQKYSLLWKLLTYYQN